MSDHHGDALAGITEDLGGGQGDDVVVRIPGHGRLERRFEGPGHVLAEIHAQVGHVFQDDHVIFIGAFADDPELFVENYQQDMQYFDNRLAFGMEDKEYKAITGENGPKYASPSNAVTYNPIGDNEKIRMYKRPTEEWLREFLNNVRKYVR